MKKEKLFFWFLFWFLIINSIILVVFFKNNITGLVIGNVSFESINNPPSWSTIPNQSWSKNTILFLNLTDYSLDPENLSLIYNSTLPANITINISNSNATLTPTTGFTGVSTIVFSAYDYISLVNSSVVYLTVNDVSSGSSGSSGGSGSGEQGAKSSEKGILAYSPQIDKGLQKGEESLMLNNLIQEKSAILTLENNDIIYFVEEVEDIYLLVTYVDPEEEFVIINFTLENQTFELNMVIDDNNLLDIDSDGLDDYYVSVENIDSGKVTLAFEEVGKSSTVLVGEELNPNSWMAVTGVITVFLISFLSFIWFL